MKIKFLNEVREFVRALPEKARKKIVRNARRVTINETDISIFKKLQGEIWELRTIYEKVCYRLLAFWDKRDSQNTLIVVTHGFIKKTQKTPKAEIEKAEACRKQYFNIKV